MISQYWPGEIIGRDDRIVELEPGPDAVPDRGAAGHPAALARTARSVEAEVAKVTRRWSDDLADLLTARASARTRPSGCCAGTAARCPRRTRRTSARRPRSRDLARLEELPADDGLALRRSTPPTTTTTADRRLKVFRTGQSVSLARALPIFTQMGIEVLDERPYEIELADGERGLDLRLRAAAAGRACDFDDDRVGATSSTRCGCCGATRSSRTASTRSSCGPA